MSDDEKEIMDNESDVSELSDNKEETEYDLATEMSLDSDFDEEDDEFQALLVPQQPLIPFQQQPRLHPHLFYSDFDQMRWNRGNCSLITPCYDQLWILQTSKSACSGIYFNVIETQLAFFIWLA